MNDKQSQIARWMKIVIEVGIILFAIGIAWATLRGSVKQNNENIKNHTVRISSVEEGVSDVKSDIREIRVEQKYISKGIDEIKEKIK